MAQQISFDELKAAVFSLTPVQAAEIARVANYQALFGRGHGRGGRGAGGRGASQGLGGRGPTAPGSAPAAQAVPAGPHRAAYMAWRSGNQGVKLNVLHPSTEAVQLYVAMRQEEAAATAAAPTYPMLSKLQLIWLELAEPNSGSEVESCYTAYPLQAGEAITESHQALFDDLLLRRLHKEFLRVRATGGMEIDEEAEDSSDTSSDFVRFIKAADLSGTAAFLNQSSGVLLERILGLVRENQKRKAGGVAGAPGTSGTAGTSSGDQGTLPPPPAKKQKGGGPGPEAGAKSKRVGTGR